MPNEDYNNVTSDTNDTDGRKDKGMTTAQVAQVLGVSNRTAARYIAKGILPVQRRNLRKSFVMLDDLRQFAEAHKLQIDEDKVKEFLAQ